VVSRGDSAFAPIARELEGALDRYYANSGEQLEGDALQRTIATNSSLVAQRGRRVLDLYLSTTGRVDLTGIELIDLGCGFGGLAVYFAHLGATVTAVDRRQDRMVVGAEIAAAAGLAVRFERRRLEALDAPSEHFDLAVINNTLCYLVDEGHRAAALEHVRRVLRAGGAVLVRDPNRLHPIDQFARLPGLGLLPPDAAVRAAGRLGRHRSRVRLRTPAGLRRELRVAGFERVRTEASPRSPALAPLRPVARYQHALGIKPDDAPDRTVPLPAPGGVDYAPAPMPADVGSSRKKRPTAPVPDAADLVEYWRHFHLGTLARINLSYLPMYDMLWHNGVSPRRLASFGSGSCTHEVALALTFPHAEVHCYDATDRYIPAYTRPYFDRLPGLTFTTYDFSVPLGERFDFVFSIQTLEHIQDSEAALDQLCDAVEPGGHLYVDTPLFHEEASREANYDAMLERAWRLHEHYHLGFSRRKTEARLRARGFEIVDSGYYSYMLADAAVVRLARAVQAPYPPPAEAVMELNRTLTQTLTMAERAHADAFDYIDDADVARRVCAALRVLAVRR
jgi:2-polyprenyl-3-methyl-5-hydroxy-6-metoxy-1,4-benzoquinol methylase